MSYKLGSKAQKADALLERIETQLRSLATPPAAG